MPAAYSHTLSSSATFSFSTPLLDVVLVQFYLLCNIKRATNMQILSRRRTEQKKEEDPLNDNDNNQLHYLVRLCLCVAAPSVACVCHMEGMVVAQRKVSEWK